MSTFSRVSKPYTFGRVGVCENQHFFHTLLTFWPDFYYFHGDCWHSKNVNVYSFFWRGGGGRRESQKVYGLYTRENVDIYGWPQNILNVRFYLQFLYFFYDSLDKILTFLAILIIISTQMYQLSGYFKIIMCITIPKLSYFSNCM